MLKVQLVGLRCRLTSLSGRRRTGEVTVKGIDSAADRAFAHLAARAEEDPAVLGLVLHGSHVFEGMATPESDYDVFLIVQDGAPPQHWQSRRSSTLDLEVTSVSGFRSAVLDGGDANRYIFAHAQVVLDRLGGRVSALLREAATLPERELDNLPVMLDAYINLLYRSIKNGRDGRDVAAHLDAAMSVNLVLWVIFALHRRTRPPNKYLAWDLERHPLGDRPWEASRLLPRIRRILVDADPVTQRALFRDVEAAARADGLGATVDAWGGDLDMLR
jgi:hypothetical protein